MKVLKYITIIVIFGSVFINPSEADLLDKIKGGIRKVKEHIHTAFCGHKTTPAPTTTTKDPNEFPDIDVRGNFVISKRSVDEDDMIFFPKESEDVNVAPARTSVKVKAPVVLDPKDIGERVFVDAPPRCPDGSKLVRSRCRTLA